MNKQIIKIILALAVAAYCFYYISTPEAWHFIDNVNLIIHEAGHWIFWPFGEFMHVLGGSLNQVLVPCLFVLYFYTNKDNYSAALILFWVGINFINVSIYAGDAVRMQLPLLGGDNVIHDWNWLMIYMGQLHHTAQIAGAIKTFGVLTITAAAVWAIYSALNDNRAYGK